MAHTLAYLAAGFGYLLLLIALILTIVRHIMRLILVYILVSF